MAKQKRAAKWFSFRSSYFTVTLVSSQLTKYFSCASFRYLIFFVVWKMKVLPKKKPNDEESSCYRTRAVKTFTELFVWKSFFFSRKKRAKTEWNKAIFSTVFNALPQNCLPFCRSRKQFNIIIGKTRKSASKIHGKIPMSLLLLLCESSTSTNNPFLIFHYYIFLFKNKLIQMKSFQPLWLQLGRMNK